VPNLIEIDQAVSPAGEVEDFTDKQAYIYTSRQNGENKAALTRVTPAKFMFPSPTFILALYLDIIAATTEMLSRTSRSLQMVAKHSFVGVYWILANTYCMLLIIKFPVVMQITTVKKISENLSEFAGPMADRHEKNIYTLL